MAYRFGELAAATAGSPTVFLFHGTGGDEHQMLGLGQQLLPGARLVAPRGDVSEYGALRFFRRRGEGLYDMEDLAARTEAMGAFIAGHTPAERSGPVLGLGYSNGANILASVLFARPELFDAAVLLHPLIPFVPADQPGLQGKPVLITAGRRDPICPPAQTEALVDYLTIQGSDVRVLWHDGGHEVRDEELAAAARFLAAGGH